MILGEVSGNKIVRLAEADDAQVPSGGLSPLFRATCEVLNATMDAGRQSRFNVQRLVITYTDLGPLGQYTIGPNGLLMEGIGPFAHPLLDPDLGLPIFVQKVANAL